MPGIGVNTAVITNNQILLTLRRDFEVWCLPGGVVDAGETLAEAARRETREETGLEVCLTHLVGAYSRPGWLDGGLHILLFAAQACGGQLHPQESEVLDLRYFALDELPESLLFGHRQRILDAFSGIGGSAVWRQAAHWPYGPEMTRADLYQQMKASDLTPREFYTRQIGSPIPGGEVLEIGGNPRDRQP